MNPSIDSIKASDGSAPASVATIQNSRSAGSSTIHVDTVAGINANFIGSMGTPHTFVDPITAETITVISEDTAVDFYGHVDGANLEIDGIAPGFTDGGSAVDDIVIIRPTTLYGDNLAAVLEVSLEDDGTPKAVSLNPTGLVAPFAGASAPSGWLLCDGSAVSRTTYADLFALVGSTYGAGNGSTTFNVPDLRSRVPFGVGTGTWSFSFAAAAVNTGTDQITVTASNEFVTGRKIQLTTTGTLPTGLSLATDYYIIVIDSTHIQLATSEANALFGTAINITGAGSGTNTGTGTLNTYTLGQHGGAQKHSHSLSATNAMANIAMAAGGVSTQNRVTTKASWTKTNQSNDSGAGSSGTNTVGSSLQGDVDMTVTVPPYVALNYIIKT